MHQLQRKPVLTVKDASHVQCTKIRNVGILWTGNFKSIIPSQEITFSSHLSHAIIAQYCATMLPPVSANRPRRWPEKEGSTAQRTPSAVMWSGATSDGGNQWYIVRRLHFKCCVVCASLSNHIKRVVVILLPVAIIERGCWGNGELRRCWLKYNN